MRVEWPLALHPLPSGSEIMAELALIISAHVRRDGTKHPNAFDARLGSSDTVVCVSETPLFDAARALLAQGKANPDDMLVMRHAGSTVDALRSKVGVAAGLRIEETGWGPKLRKYRPRPAMYVPPSIEQTPSLVPEQAPARETHARA